MCKSVAHAGFDRIVIIDGHGSNEHLCEFIARRATLGLALGSALALAGLALGAAARAEPAVPTVYVNSPLP